MNRCAFTFPKVFFLYFIYMHSCHFHLFPSCLDSEIDELQNRILCICPFNQDLKIIEIYNVIRMLDISKDEM